MKKYVDVILPLPLPKSFTYSLPDECAEDVKIGCRVVVPFGRKKFYTAIVLNVHYCAPTEYEVKDISALLDASPILLPAQFKFWEWIADYYLCTQGDVYKAALPSGLKLESETIVEYNPDFEADAPLPEREQRILDLLAIDSQQCVTKLEKDSGIKNILAVIKSLLDKEAIFVKEELRRTYKPKTEARVRHILFFTIEADTGVEGNTVNPGGNLTFFSEFGIGFPKVQYHILIQIIERSIGIGIQIAYLVDHPFIFADHRQKLLFNRGANLCCLFSHGIYDYFSG